MKIELKDLIGIVACYNCGGLVTEYKAYRKTKYWGDERKVVYYCNICEDIED